MHLVHGIPARSSRSGALAAEPAPRAVSSILPPQVHTRGWACCLHVDTVAIRMPQSGFRRLTSNSAAGSETPSAATPAVTRNAIWKACTIAAWSGRCPCRPRNPPLPPAQCRAVPGPARSGRVLSAPAPPPEWIGIAGAAGTAPAQHAADDETEQHRREQQAGFSGVHLQAQLNESGSLLLRSMDRYACHASKPQGSDERLQSSIACGAVLAVKLDVIALAPAQGREHTQKGPLAPTQK